MKQPSYMSRRGLETWFFVALFASTLHAQNSYVNFEGKQTNPIRLSSDGTRLFAVNTPDARLSVFDVTHPSNPFLIAEIPVGVEPVSVNPRNNDEVWVVNEVSDSVSVVSVSQRAVIDTIHVKDEPADVVFAGGRAFVSAARNNQIAVFDAASHASLTNIAVFGENPRALAVNTNGTKIYAAFALSGNHTTILPASNAPPQLINGTPPMDPSLPPPPQVSLIIDATNPLYFPSVIQYTMPDNDVVEIDVATLSISRYFSHVGTVNLGLSIQPGSGNLFVANTEARNLTHFEPAINGHAVDNRITQIDINTGSVTPFDLNSNIDYTLLPNPAALSTALAQPTALVFDPSGNFMYTAAFGSDRVAKVSPDGTVLARIEIGNAAGSSADPRHKRGPRGLAFNGTAQRLYVMNRISNTISIIDTGNDAVLKEIPAGSSDPTPVAIREGRGFLYDAKLSGNGTMSCASCHIDAEMDLIAWDLGDPTGQLVTNQIVVAISNAPFFLTNISTVHPMKGPTVTQTLRGLNGLQPFHWRGDRTNFLHFNIAFSSLLGGPQLSDTDMAAYRDFINTIVFEPNPNENLNRTYSTSIAGGGDASRGLTQFTGRHYDTVGLFCQACHTPPPGSGSDHLIISRTQMMESQDFKVPHLRNAYQKTSFNNAPGTNSIGGFGFSHDGAFSSVRDFLSTAVFDAIRDDESVKNDLAAFVKSFDTGTAPAVGYTDVLRAANVTTSSISNEWSIMQSQALASNIDLVASGTIDGVRHRLFYQPSTATYRPDTTNLAPLTRTQLTTKIKNGDIVHIIGVPWGSGVRMAIDHDGDGVLDRDTPPPGLVISPTNGSFVLHWPLAAAGFAPESSASLAPGSWTNLSDPVEIAGGQNYITNSSADGVTFYRLKFPYP